MIRMRRFVPLPTPWGLLLILWATSLASEAGGDVVAACEHFITTVAA